MSSKEKRVQPVVLTIAGFDPSGGAGIIADIKAFTAFDCAAVAAVTSLTFQNSTTMFGATHQTAETVREQVNAILEGTSIAAVKTGMLPTGDIVREVSRLFRESNLPAPIVDPVMQSTSGYDLIEADALDLLVKELMPLARLVTPNIPEAERITGLRISDEAEMRLAAYQIREMGARAVLIKGGHLEQQRSEVRGQRSARGSSPTIREGSDQAIDVLDNDGEVTVFRGDWIQGSTLRGTGCMLSSAIAACLANGMALKESVGAAKRYVTASLAKSEEQRATRAER